MLAGDHLHHLTSLVELLDESVHLLNVRTATLGDAHASACVQQCGILALFGSHGEDDGLYALEGIIVDVDVLQCFAYTGNHACQVLDVTHLLDLLNLGIEVVEVELVLLDALFQSACLLLVVLLLCFLHQADDVAHAQYAVGHAGRVEGAHGLHLLASTHELDGLVHNTAYGEGSTATCVTIQFCQDDTRVVESVVELLGCVHGILTRHCVHHEQDFVWVDCVADVLNLLHQFLVDGQSAGSIHDDDIIGMLTSLVDGVQSHLHGIGGPHLYVDRHIHLLAQYAQLLHSSGSEGVAGSQQGLFGLFLLEHLGQFGTECGLTRTVQTGHQDDAWFAYASGQVQFCRLATHQLGQFVVNNLHHQLSRLHGGQHVLSQCLLLHVVGKRLRNFIVDVGVQQCAAHILQGLGHVYLGDAAFTFQYLKRPFKSFTKVFKHSVFLRFLI